MPADLALAAPGSCAPRLSHGHGHLHHQRRRGGRRGRGAGSSDEEGGLGKYEELTGVAIQGEG